MLKKILFILIFISSITLFSEDPAIQVVVNVSGTSLFIDGRFHSNQPLDIGSDEFLYYVETTNGTHQVEVKHNNYQTQKIQVVVKNNVVVENIYFSKSKGKVTSNTDSSNNTVFSKVGKIIVESKPTKARVLLDKSLSGITSAIYEDISIGKHSIEVSFPSKPKLSLDFELGSNEEIRIIADFFNNTISIDAEYDVTINTNIKGAKVYINNKYKGVSPLTLKDISYGKYELKIVKDDYITIAEVLNVTGSDFKDYQLKEKPFSAKFQILNDNSLLSTDDILINGEKYNGELPTKIFQSREKSVNIRINGIRKIIPLKKNQIAYITPKVEKELITENNLSKFIPGYKSLLEKPVLEPLKKTVTTKKEHRYYNFLSGSLLLGWIPSGIAYAMNDGDDGDKIGSYFATQAILSGLGFLIDLAQKPVMLEKTEVIDNSVEAKRINDRRLEVWHNSNKKITEENEQLVKEYQDKIDKENKKRIEFNKTVGQWKVYYN